jgi:hypothetical protein
MRRIESVPKIHIVILSVSEESLFSFQIKKSKEEILRTYVLRMTKKGKFTKILEHPLRRILFLFLKSIKTSDPSAYGLRMTRNDSIMSFCSHGKNLTSYY